MSILLPQPVPLSQPSPSDSDEVLRNFLQEMAELDRQPPATPEPNIPKHHAADTPRPAKKVKQTPVLQSQEQKPATRWKRRKLELQTLKEQADTLSGYVSFLQTRRTPGQLPAGPVNLPPELDQLVQIETGGWQAAAIREIRRCQAAQKENEELKQRLQAYVQVSGALQTALNTANTLREQQLAQDSIAGRALRVELMMNQQVDASDNALIFAMLEANLNARANTEVQIVADEMSQPVQLAESDQVSICRKDETHAAVEFKTVRVLPFDADTVSKECWRVAELGWKREHARVVRRSKDVVSSDWCFPVQLEKGEAMEIRVRSVAKRFRVEEGFVVLAESTTEWPAHLAASGAWSRVTRERGWGLVHSYPSRSAAQNPSRPSASVSRFLMHVTTEPFGLDSDTSRKLLGSPAVSDVVIPSFRTLIKNRQQTVDNRLMDSAFATPIISAV
ncbi:hypothetical protein PF005_g24101 [Phytophthora fragariae]|nr:hypothetical protein PF003_g22905 [Phytophthora fragariae]KAE9073077.1 hypothetical protein PF010_g25226 [Phytophthora fragariae]KAE9077796.1 hypothetical protein PF007_g24109 [Phytophthora fragariae]KAE9097438.1 hypothetical protein PF006_g23577 [Phytophthora fragariae]KAE9178379.1 hypothetical protein PF005_g24101 [Phytophthora fragariae]